MSIENLKQQIEIHKDNIKREAEYAQERLRNAIDKKDFTHVGHNVAVHAVEITRKWQHIETLEALVRELESEVVK